MKCTVLLKVKLQGLEAFSFTIKDAQRDPKTGVLPNVSTEVDIPAISVASAADDTADEEGDPEEATDDDGSADEEGGSTTEELEGEDFDIPDVCVYDQLPDDYPSCIIGRKVYHRYDDGWYPGVVLRLITLSTVASRNGKFAMKFEDSANEIAHNLKKDDYGTSGHWVLVKTEL